MQIIRVRLNTTGETGIELAPVEIIKSLRKIHCNEKGKEINVSSMNLEEIHVDLHNQTEAHQLIFHNSKEIFEKHERSLFIGGDQSIMYSISRAFFKMEKNPLLLLFDCYTDCTPGALDNRSWLYHIITQGISGNSIILIGARNYTLEEKIFIKEKGITLISMDLIDEEIQEVADLLMERCRLSSGFFVSVDMRVIDPAFAPGVNQLDAGGLTSRDILYFIRRLQLLNQFRGGSIVEINPLKDFNGMTVKLGARILAEMM